jgi:CDP-glucose 4,6-dehydratase
MFQGLVHTYHGKKVFLTGHTGFKGAWLLRWLHLLGAEVRGYGLNSTADGNLYKLMNGDAICDSVIADIRDRGSLERALLAFRPDFVFHLAAQSLVRYSYEAPEETFETNAMGTANLLQALRSIDHRCVAVMITTDKVYENEEWIYPYRENDRLGGRDPYSASKACAELIISCYIRSFFNSENHDHHQKAIGIARAGNVIGGGDRAKDRIIPDIIRALENQQPVFVRNPGSIRPWQHVLEPIGGYLLLGEQLAGDPGLSGEAWNFGPLPEDHLTVDGLIRTAIKIWGSGEYKNVALKDQPHEAGLLKLDISKASSRLNWKPKMRTLEAIEWTMNWYKHDVRTIVDFTDAQIKEYQAR